MTHRNENTDLNSAAQHLADTGLDGLPEAFRILIDHAMKLERAKVLQAQPHERTATRQGYANGFKPKTVATRLGDICFSVPQVRGDVSFYPSALEKGLRSERALKLAIAEMYIQGVSTRKVAAVLEQLCGLDISSTQVSRATADLDLELDKWRNRQLGSFLYLIVDARYEKVRMDGVVRSCAVLIAVGIDAQGKRSVLGVSAKLSEAEIHWREFLASLQSRGLHGLRLIVSDDHAGLRAAAQHQLKTIAAKYKESAPNLADWLESNVPESLTVFALPEPQRKKLRTSNSLERLNKEIKRRTRVATLFPNEKSLERLVSALLSEVSDEWESSNSFLNMKN